MNKAQSHNLESGFTLIEVLVALTIFAIGLLALASMQVMSLKGNTTSQRITSATALAEGAMEWLQSLPANDVLFDANATDEPVTNAPFDANGKVTVAGGGTMTVTYDIVTDPPPATGATSFPGNVVRINVKVAHSASSGNDVNLTSLKWVR